MCVFDFVGRSKDATKGNGGEGGQGAGENGGVLDGCVGLALTESTLTDDATFHRLNQSPYAEALRELRHVLNDLRCCDQDAPLWSVFTPERVEAIELLTGETPCER